MRKKNFGGFCRNAERNPRNVSQKYFFLHREMIAKHGVCIRVLGNLDLLPSDIQHLIAEAMSFSRNNKK